MNKRRLLKLADLLEADAKNKKGVKFDLANWATVGDNAYGFSDDPVKIDCGTHACAVGLACVSGAFKKSGLTYDINWQGTFAPKFDGWKGWAAVNSFWDIRHAEAEFLFSRQSYPKAKTKGAAGELYVAKRIRDFVAGKAKPAVA